MNIETNQTAEIQEQIMEMLHAWNEVKIEVEAEAEAEVKTEVEAEAEITAKVVEEAAVEEAEVVEVEAEVKPVAKYIVQRAKRQRYFFGNVWLNAVLAGVVTDIDKLVAHGVKLNAGTQTELAALDKEALLTKVQDALLNEPTTTAE